MNTVLLALITVAFVVAVAVFIRVMIELSGVAKNLKEFIKSTEVTLNPALEELQLTLKSVRNVTDNVTQVTEDVREVSCSIRDVGRNVKQVSDLIEDVTSLTVGRVSGLKAGISTAIEVLVKNLFSRRT
jgi:uncharacterized protein YoxC